LKGKEEGRGRRRLEKTFSTYMSIKNMIFKYKEYKMAVEGVHNDMVIALYANEEIEIIECQVCI